ncbi:hybrid sensor histidine kinase/response regulator [Microbulbifer agarilyticus]|uniref:hybrid sensor histidine kinase/response regulator n=1 Tax=Microbulbifer agarilyticus TaxID=260552 RepID=UPI001CD61F53|nr:ATP-binding protein [Microbulbifer agarilyticus]MCA0899564.1 response regulator [Microbulbifer agarilyticus]
MVNVVTGNDNDNEQQAMRPAQQVFRVRRTYNKWVGDETLEDFALRFTAVRGRRFTIEQVAKTALGATAFLALEAIAAAVTLNYGFINTVAAMLAVAAVIFITGFPISYYAAKHGLDIDLLTRGAGFGYLGSTITSLIYASFTFIFFAIEAAILTSALHALLGIPPAIGYILCAVAVIPIVTHGIQTISKFQIGTQPVWLFLQCLALAIAAWFELSRVEDWTRYAPQHNPQGAEFNWMLFGAAGAVFFAMVAQIGEQVDYLRFMPEKTRENRKRWWFWLTLAGPGWILIGVIKMLFGSFLAYLAITRGASSLQAADPVYMYQMVFNYITQSPTMALILAGIMVVVSQMKINVTNAYAGSIAWSNFFSRLTRSHPGRVVWLVFNVSIALILMELGIYGALEGVLGIFSLVAISWLGCLAADLMINKPLGISPSYVEFKRSHLYDFNPVGVGSMLLASVIGILCYLGHFGEGAKNFSSFISLAICFVMVPFFGVVTRGHFYLAVRRNIPDDDFQVDSGTIQSSKTCCICQNDFEPADVSSCPAYQGPICSLCCSLDSRCMDACKPDAHFSQQLLALIKMLVPDQVADGIDSRLGRFTVLLIGASACIAGMLSLIYGQIAPTLPAAADALRQTFWTLFVVLVLIAGVLCWLFLLTHDSRVVAQLESNRQTRLLISEIEAHKETDRALQFAKEEAESANSAKSRYLSGISHELRTPLQSILGYAQLLNQQTDIPDKHRNGLRIIKRSGEYLTDLIEGLLDISKIEAGRLDIYRNRVRLPELIEQMVDMFGPQAEAKGIQLHCHIHSTLPYTVIADEKRLRQILINLLSNAIKYTRIGKVDFHIRYRNQVAEFTIADTGVGIHPEHQARILKPFERVRNGDSPTVTGTGLGLTIAYLLAEIMGGELRMESTPGKGSRFTVSLLLSWVDSERPREIPTQNLTGYQGPRQTIMVVDDEAIHRGLIGELLAPLGFTLREAQSAEDCLAQLEQGNPDLFLLDVSMPGMDGLTLAKTLRERAYNGPIVMLSAEAKEHHLQPGDSCKAHHDAYLVKPLVNQKLYDTMAELLALEWCFDSDVDSPTDTTVNSESDKSCPADTQKDTQTDILPKHPLLVELLAYARIGYRGGVQRILDKVATAGIVSEQQLEEFRQLANSMRLERLSESLVNHSREPTKHASEESP